MVSAGRSISQNIDVIEVRHIILQSLGPPPQRLPPPFHYGVMLRRDSLRGLRPFPSCQSAALRGRLALLKRFCPPSFHYGGTAFAGYARSRLVNPPLFADGLPSRKKIRQGNLPDFRRLVGVIELESMTSTMSTWRSNQLSYTPDKLAPAAGFEPATKWLTATYSTAELCRSVCPLIYPLFAVCQSFRRKKKRKNIAGPPTTPPGDPRRLLYFRKIGCIL